MTKAGLLLLLTGPAGAGKSTVARLWAASRPRGVHIQLDHIRSLIVGGYAEPQERGPAQTEQYEVSALACISLARQFTESGYDVVLCDVFPRELFERLWRPRLNGVEWRIVVLLPELNETLKRAARRKKEVREDIIREQHAAMALWEKELVIDPTGITAEEVVDALG